MIMGESYYKDLTVILETRETISRQLEVKSDEYEDMMDEMSCDEGIGENDSRNYNMQVSSQ